MSYERFYFGDASEFHIPKEPKFMGWLEKCPDGIYRPQKRLPYPERVLQIVENKSGNVGK